jgi:DNA-binding transcriptional LysR family regulator
LAAAGSFTKAAKVLHLSQPALTTRIRQLEEALNLRLFDRSTRSVRLSDEGVVLLPTFLQLVGDLESAVLKARERSKRSEQIIRLACLPSCASHWLPPLISEFRVKNPKALFVVNDGVDSIIRRMVMDREVDFGVCTFEPEEVDLEVIELYTDTLVAVFAAGHRIEKVQRLTVKELSKHPLILMTRGSSVRHVIDRTFAAAACAATPACEVNYMSTALALAKSGVGVAILPASAMELSLNGFRIRPIDDPGFVRKLALIRRQSAGCRSIVQDFISLALRRASSLTPRAPASLNVSSAVS